jgi:hypothetical protein
MLHATATRVSRWPRSIPLNWFCAVTPPRGEEGAAFPKLRQRALPPHVRRAGGTRARAAAKAMSSAARAPLHVHGSPGGRGVSAWPLTDRLIIRSDRPVGGGGGYRRKRC